MRVGQARCQVRHNRPMDSSLAISMILGAIATVLLVVGLLGIVAGRKQATWMRVSGRVVRSKVEYRGEEFAADIVYSYQHNHIEYTGDTVSFPQFVYNWRGPAERICRRYPEGATINVYLNPQDPKRSVLEPPSGAGMVACLIASVLFFVIAWAMK